MVELALSAKEKYKLNSKIINASFIKPLDEKMLRNLMLKNYNILTIEDGILNGGLGSMITRKLEKFNYKGKIVSLGYDDKFIEQGTIDELLEEENITVENIKKIIRQLENEKNITEQ